MYGEEKAPGIAQFCYQNGLLYRKWSPDGSSKNMEACEQLVLPKQCWSAALQLAHDVLPLDIWVSIRPEHGPAQVLLDWSV